MLPLLLLWTTTTSVAGAALLPPPPLPIASDEAQRLMALQLEDYFAAEESQGLVFLSAGLVSLAAGGVLVSRDDPASTAAVFPAAGVGLVQVVVGAVLLTRTDEQVAELNARRARDPISFATDERQRMDHVMTRFSIIHIAEIVLAVVGASMFAWGELEDVPELRGFGLSIAAESALMLGLDYLAADRGGRYARALRTFDDGLRRP